MNVVWFKSDFNNAGNIQFNYFSYFENMNRGPFAQPSFINTGEITFKDYALFCKGSTEYCRRIENLGSFTNKGTMNLSSAGFHTLTNEKILNIGDSNFDNYGGGHIINSGIITAAGASAGEITNKEGGIITVSNTAQSYIIGGPKKTSFKSLKNELNATFTINKGYMVFNSESSNAGEFNTNAEIKIATSLKNSGILNAKANSVFVLSEYCAVWSVTNQCLEMQSSYIDNSGTLNTEHGSLFEVAVKNSGVVYTRGATFKKDVENLGIFNVSDNLVSFTENFNNKLQGIFTAKYSTKITKDFRNETGARVELVGATLTAQKFTNSGILIFSMLNSIMGQLVVNQFVNQVGGKIQVDVAGLTLSKYQIIIGTISGTPYEVEFINSAGSIIDGWTYDAQGWISNTNSGSGGQNPDKPKPEPTKPDPKPEKPEPTKPNQNNTAQNPNYETLQKTLESKLLSMNDSDIVQAVLDTETMLKTSIITQPTNMLKAFKADTLNTPLNSAYVTRLTASSASIMSDASSFSNPLEKASQTQFFATPFGGVLKGDDLSGHLLGLSVGLTHIDDDYIAQGHFAYANGTSTQDLQTQSTQINGNLFQVGGFGRLFYDKLETDINANFIFAKFSLDNTWLDNGLNSSSNFNNYQINLGAVAGWRFGDDLSVKPFAGLQTYYENQGEFKQDMLKLTSEAYSALVMDALVGVEGRYIFENGGFAFAKASYENKLYNSHKEVFMRVGTEALRYENESYDNVASLNLGARVLATKALKLDIESLYKHYDNGVDYLGANLSVRWSF